MNALQQFQQDCDGRQILDAALICLKQDGFVVIEHNEKVIRWKVVQNSLRRTVGQKTTTYWEERQ